MVIVLYIKDCPELDGKNRKQISDLKIKRSKDIEKELKKEKFKVEHVFGNLGTLVLDVTDEQLKELKKDPRFLISPDSEMSLI